MCAIWSFKNYLLRHIKNKFVHLNVWFNIQFNILMRKERLDDTIRFIHKITHLELQYNFYLT